LCIFSALFLPTTQSEEKNFHQNILRIHLSTSLSALALLERGARGECRQAETLLADPLCDIKNTFLPKRVLESSMALVAGA
jgi:hypothetical protein